MSTHQIPELIKVNSSPAQKRGIFSRLSKSITKIRENVIERMNCPGWFGTRTIIPRRKAVRWVPIGP